PLRLQEAGAISRWASPARARIGTPLAHAHTEYPLTEERRAQSRRLRGDQAATSRQWGVVPGRGLAYVQPPPLVCAAACGLSDRGCGTAQIRDDAVQKRVGQGFGHQLRE